MDLHLVKKMSILKSIAETNDTKWSLSLCDKGKFVTMPILLGKVILDAVILKLDICKFCNENLTASIVLI